MDIWNQRFVSPPPNITVLYDRNELSKLGELTSQKLALRVDSPEMWVTNLNKMLKNAKEQLSGVSTTLELELKCLHSYIYQGGGIHKKEKYVIAIKKVSRCLKRWKELNIRKLILVNYDMIPKEFLTIHKIRLPSPRSMYYLLHRVVGGFRLLLKSVSYCLESAFYFKAKLVRGFSIPTSTLGMAIIGRIRALTLDLCNILSTLNDQLNPYVMPMVETKTSEKIEDLPYKLQEELTKFLENKPSEEKRQKGKAKKVKGKSEINASSKSLQSFEDIEEGKDDVGIIADEETGKASSDIADITYNFTFSATCVGMEEDLGDSISYSKFNELKNLAGCVLETSKSLETRNESKRNNKHFSNENNSSLKRKKQKVNIEYQNKNSKRKKKTKNKK